MRVGIGIISNLRRGAGGTRWWTRGEALSRALAHSQAVRGLCWRWTPQRGPTTSRTSRKSGSGCCVVMTHVAEGQARPSACRMRSDIGKTTTATAP